MKICAFDQRTLLKKFSIDIYYALQTTRVGIFRFGLRGQRLLLKKMHNLINPIPVGGGGIIDTNFDKFDLGSQR